MHFQLSTVRLVCAFRFFPSNNIGPLLQHKSIKFLHARLIVFFVKSRELARNGADGDGLLQALSFLLFFLNTRGLVVGVGREDDGAFHHGSDRQELLQRPKH